MGFSGTLPGVAPPPGLEAAPHRPRRRPTLRPSTLLLLGTVLLPIALLPLGRLVTTLDSEGDTVRTAAALAADRLAEALAGPAAALRRMGPHGAPAGELARAEPPLHGARAEDARPRPPAAGPSLPGNGTAELEPDLATLAAVLDATPAPAGTRFTLLGPDGRVLARSPAGGAADTSPFLAAEQPLPGWPIRVRATRGAPAPDAGLLPLGTAMLAMLLLALLAHRRERMAEAAARLVARRDAARNATLAESEAQLRLALAAAGLGCWSWDEPLDRLDWDGQAAAILGWQPDGWVRSAALRDRLDPADHAVLGAAIARARRSGEPAQCALRLRAAPGAATRWIELRTQAAPGPSGTIWHGVVADITARRRAEDQERLLLREVDHRARNTLAVVQALLRLTRTEDPAGVLPRVEARIAALARAHTLLAQSRWQGASLHRLAAAELGRNRPGDGERPVLAGPPVTISPVATQPVAMVLHELASNAAHHGALAGPGGSLSATWRVERCGGLELVWQEHRGGPDLPGPPVPGLGTRIMEATVRDQLGGRIERDWTPEGLRCVIRLPAACLTTGIMDAAA